MTTMIKLTVFWLQVAVGFVALVVLSAFIRLGFKFPDKVVAYMLKEKEPVGLFDPKF